MKSNDVAPPFQKKSWGRVQAYAGPSMPKKSVAIIKSNAFSLRHTAYIESVDGKSVQGCFKAELLPGKHTVVIGVILTRVLGGNQTSETVSFDARAGHVYHIRAQKGKLKTFLWIENKRSKEVVAGQRP